MSAKKRYIILVIMALLTTTVCGQQSQPFTQYLFNRFLLNPAACGADGYTSVGLIVKDQWTGFAGAPFNQTLTAQVRVPREGFFGKGGMFRSQDGFNPENIGLGFTMFNDVRGLIRTTGGSFTYAYHIETETSQFSFGLATSFSQLYIDRNKIVTELGYDRYIDANRLSTFIPEAAFGMHYTARDYYAGFSVSNLFQSYLTFGGRNSSGYKLERQYLVLGGYVFEINREWTLVPGIQFKINERAATQIDVSAIIYYYDQFWGGISYRSDEGGSSGWTSAIFGVRFGNYNFGYAFDYSIGNMQKFSYGSHEIMAIVTFGKVDRFNRLRRRYEFQDSELQYRNMWVGRRRR